MHKLSTIPSCHLTTSWLSVHHISFDCCLRQQSHFKNLLHDCEITFSCGMTLFLVYCLQQDALDIWKWVASLATQLKPLLVRPSPWVVLAGWVNSYDSAWNCEHAETWTWHVGNMRTRHEKPGEIAQDNTTGSGITCNKLQLMNHIIHWYLLLCLNLTLLPYTSVAGVLASSLAQNSICVELACSSLQFPPGSPVYPTVHGFCMEQAGMENGWMICITHDVFESSTKILHGEWWILACAPCVSHVYDE